MKTATAILLLALSSPLMAGNFIRLHSPRTTVFTQYFRLYDTNDDDLLSFAEFQGTVGASDVPVVTEYRFRFMSNSVGSGAEAEGGIPLGIVLPNYIRFAGGLKVPKPPKFLRFEYADDNNDGFLSPEEWAQTRNLATATSASLAKGFAKKDKDDDGLISPAEFGLIKA